MSPRPRPRPSARAGATTPGPGRPVRGSTSGRPLMAALDLLGRRWTLRILWELRDGSLGARALRARCDDMSSSVLYARLAELRVAGLVSQHVDDDTYALTPIGRQLGQAIDPLQRWAERWSSAQRAALTTRHTPRSASGLHLTRRHKAYGVSTPEGSAGELFAAALGVQNPSSPGIRE